jgi:hypothetical protein
VYECKLCNKDRSAQNFSNLSRGQPWDCPNLYVVPPQAKQKITEVEEEIQGERSCFRVVKGDHGEGKTAMLHHIQTQIAKNRSVCYSYIFYDKSWITSESSFSKGFLSLLFSSFTFPNGAKLEERLLNDAEFRGELSKLLYDEVEGLNLEFSTIWKDYAWALYKACDNTKSTRGLALSYLKGQNLSPDERTSLKVSKVNIWGTNPTPMANALKFYTVLSRRLGFNGYLLALDEIEQLGYLGPVTGKALLSKHRDLVNLQDRVLKKDGCHIFYSISTWYLDESGLLKAAPSAAGVRIAGPRTRVQLSDVDRFDQIVRDENTIPTTIGDSEFYEIIHRMIGHFAMAHPTAAMPSISEDELYKEAVKRAGGMNPRKVLIEVYGLLKARTGIG